MALNERRPALQRLLLPLAAIAFFVETVQGMAESGERVHVRGDVISLDDATLLVHSREGADVSLHLTDDWAATGVVPASLADIKVGVFIGTASAPQSDGSQRALEVVVFPEAMRGVGEGHYPWDLAPESKMTNANIANAVDGVKGRTLSLAFKGGEREVTIPSDAPIVTFAPATKSDIAPGAHVFVQAVRQADGSLSANRVVVGKSGVVPPM